MKCRFWSSVNGMPRSYRSHVALFFSAAVTSSSSKISISSFELDDITMQSDFISKSTATVHFSSLLLCFCWLGSGHRLGKLSSSGDAGRYNGELSGIFMIGSVVCSRRLPTNINDPDSVCMSLFFGEDDFLARKVLES